MNYFLCVKLRSDWARRSILERIIKHGPDSVPLAGKKITLYRQERFNTIVFSVEAEQERFNRGSQTFATPTKALLYDGVPFLEGKALTAPWSDSLERLLSSHPVGEVYQMLCGQYSLIHARRGNIQAFSDFSGLSPLYYLANSHCIGISNRQWLLQMTCLDLDTPSFDLEVLAWLIEQGNIFGDKSVFKGVQRLIPGRWLEVCDNGRSEIHPFPSQFWGPFDGTAGYTSADYDQATDHLLGNFRAIKEMCSQKINLTLTGGKDSRLNLALAISSGLADNLNIVTGGPEDSPEIECAACICKELGLPHISSIQKNSEIDLSAYWNYLRHHPFRYDASICPWDGVKPLSSSLTVEINGMGGELYRNLVKNRKETTISTMQQAQQIWRNWTGKIDCAELVHPYILEKHYQQNLSWLEQRIEEGVPIENLDDVFYVENRLGFWSAVLASNTLQRRLFLLLHPNVSRIAYKAGVHQRRIERLHFEVLKRVNPKLLNLPFLNDTWDERLFDNQNGDTPSPPFQSKVKPLARTLYGWQWKLVENCRDTITEIITSSPSSGLYDICDKKKLHAFLDDYQINSTATCLTILSTIGIQLLLTGGYLKASDTSLKDDESGHLKTNIKNLTIEGHGRIQRLRLGEISGALYGMKSLNDFNFQPQQSHEKIDKPIMQEMPGPKVVMTSGAGQLILKFMGVLIELIGSTRKEHIVRTLGKNAPQLLSIYKGAKEFLERF